ncbi:hypothetical protein QP028_10425 [Corynebacterium suedekumii]|nr:hypothetical protein QP028_10425 [Corynebacterium suedekumii]
MTDLDIANPYDISPAGGSVTEAQLTGTPPGFEDPVSVVVSLRLVGEMFHMEPVTLVDAPTGREDDVRAAFTYSLDTRRLPLAGRASSVVLGGGFHLLRGAAAQRPCPRRRSLPRRGHPALTRVSGCG